MARAGKDDFMVEMGLATQDEEGKVSYTGKLTSCPDVPGQFDPDRHNLLKEDNFDDNLDYFKFRQRVYLFLADTWGEKVSKLENIAPEERARYAAALDGLQGTASHLRKLAAAGIDVTEILAAAQKMGQSL